MLATPNVEMPTPILLCLRMMCLFCVYGICTYLWVHVEAWANALLLYGEQMKTRVKVSKLTMHAESVNHSFLLLDESSLRLLPYKDPYQDQQTYFLPQQCVIKPLSV